jgi:type VI secretion system protein ImpJ
MTFSSKVIWSEGMFIRAQHFQQNARYFERLVRGRVSGLRGYDWGLTEIRFNRELLATGRFALERASGIFMDGTPFSMPDDTDHPAPFLVPPETRDAILYLTVPISQPGGFEASEGDGEPVTRYVISETDVASANAGQLSVAPIQVGRLRLSYALEGADLSGLQTIGVARILEVRADNSIALDESYIPPLLSTQAGPYLSSLVNEVVGLLHHRGEAIAARLSAGG